MRPHEWNDIYEQIIRDLDIDPSSDESSARLLKVVMMNSDLVSDDDVRIGKDVTVFGNGPDLENDIDSRSSIGTLISAGSATKRLMEHRIMPDILVTDLDGDIASQIECNGKGALTFIHAHGDNSELIQRYAPEFKGPVILTTQCGPDNTISNYGGFTDGDRAVCIARHFGAKRILLLGFDFENPTVKEGSDPDIKQKKLKWAKKIIFEYNEADVNIELPN